MMIMKIDGIRCFFSNNFVWDWVESTGFEHFDCLLVEEKSATNLFEGWRMEEEVNFGQSDALRQSFGEIRITERTDSKTSDDSKCSHDGQEIKMEELKFSNPSLESIILENCQWTSNCDVMGTTKSLNRYLKCIIPLKESKEMDSVSHANKGIGGNGADNSMKDGHVDNIDNDDNDDDDYVKILNNLEWKVMIKLSEYDGFISSIEIEQNPFESIKEFEFLLLPLDSYLKFEKKLGWKRNNYFDEHRMKNISLKKIRCTLNAIYLHVEGILCKRNYHYHHHQVNDVLTKNVSNHIGEINFDIYQKDHIDDENQQDIPITPIQRYSILCENGKHHYSNFILPTGSAEKPVKIENTIASSGFQDCLIYDVYYVFLLFNSFSYFGSLLIRISTNMYHFSTYPDGQFSNENDPNEFNEFYGDQKIDQKIQLNDSSWIRELEGQYFDISSLCLVKEDSENNQYSANDILDFISNLIHQDALESFKSYRFLFTGLKVDYKSPARVYPYVYSYFRDIIGPELWISFKFQNLYIPIGKAIAYAPRIRSEKTQIQQNSMEILASIPLHPYVGEEPNVSLRLEYSSIVASYINNKKLANTDTVFNSQILFLKEILGDENFERLHKRFSVGNEYRLERVENISFKKYFSDVKELGHIEVNEKELMGSFIFLSHFESGLDVGFKFESSSYHQQISLYISRGSQSIGALFSKMIGQSCVLCNFQNLKTLENIMALFGVSPVSNSVEQTIWKQSLRKSKFMFDGLNKTIRIDTSSKKSKISFIYSLLMQQVWLFELNGKEFTKFKFDPLLPLLKSNLLMILKTRRGPPPPFSDITIK